MNKMPKFTLRVSITTLNKIKYMAAFNGRSKNKEIEVAIKRYIKDFERLHGNIETETDFEE